MELAEIMRAADEPFGGCVMLAAAGVKEPGDTLAIFVARELGSIYDPTDSDVEQVSKARGALERAVDNLLDACSALDALV